MPDGLVLYNYELDESCYKVRLALSLLGLAWQAVAVDVFPGKEHLSPPFLAMNPSGRLPILRDGDLVLHGTEAILAHLARSHDPTGKWLPAQGVEFAEVMQWLFGTRGDETSLRTASSRAIRIMDDHMTARGFEGLEWFAAGHPTIADI